MSVALQRLRPIHAQVDDRQPPVAERNRPAAPDATAVGPSRRQDGADPVYRGDVGIFPVEAHLADQSAHYVLRSRSAAPSGCCLPPRSGTTTVSVISLFRAACLPSLVVQAASGSALPT